MPEEREGRVKRRLAAILAADVVAYSRLMERDEEGTHRRVAELFGNLVAPAIVAHGGRLVSTAGDGLIAEFPSAVDAVRLAVDLQGRLNSQNAQLAAEQRIELRIGVNVGDIIAGDDDIFGAGVNVAARLEQMCEPCGVYISRRVFEDIEGKLEAKFRDLGEHKFKNIDRPVRVFALASSAAPPAARARS